MLEEQDDPISRYYEKITKMEQKLYNHVQNLNKLVRSSQIFDPTHRTEQQNQNIEKNILEYEAKIQKFVKVSNREIASISMDLQQYVDENDHLETRFTVLTESKKQLIQTITNLKQELHDNKSLIAKNKKFDAIVNSLTNQLKLEQSSVNKLQLAYNNALRLQNDMEIKIRQLQHQENQSVARVQWQNQRQIQGENYLKYSQKYQKLADSKNQAFKKLEQQVGGYNKGYLEKFANLSALKTRIKGIDQIYEELEVNVNQQELIIKEILIKQGLSSSYLLQITKKENEGLNQSSEEQTSKNIQKNLQKFRRKIGMPSTSHGNEEKLYTQPTPTFQQGKQLHQSDRKIKNIMRLTTKLPETELRQRVKRSSLQHQSSVAHNVNKLSKKPSKNMSVFLPPIYNNQDVSYFPISHTAPRNQKPKKSKGSYSHQITHSKMFLQENSQLPSENQDLMLLENHFVRIRTKGGYIYKNINNNNSSYNTSRGDRSEIVNLYQKLTYKQRFMTESQADKGPEAYAKLGKSRLKGKQSNKKFIQTRQSDPDHQKGKLKLNIKTESNEDDKKTNKQIEKLSDDENKIETRRRLNTIHQEQQGQETKNK